MNTDKTRKLQRRHTKFKSGFFDFGFSSAFIRVHLWLIQETTFMFKELGQFAGMLKALPKIRAEMDKLQQRLGEISAEGDAGAGMLRVKVNGNMEMLACTISDE